MSTSGFSTVRSGIAGAIAAVLVLAGCSRGSDKDLWSLRFDDEDARRASLGTDVGGYWEGQVAMGPIRMRLDRTSLILALRCDRDGRKLAQSRAKVTFVVSASRIVLDEDLSAGDETCGFRFNKGNAFPYTMTFGGQLEIGFAGASVSRLTKIGELKTS